MKVSKKSNKETLTFHFHVTYWRLPETQTEGLTEKYLQRDCLADMVLGDLTIFSCLYVDISE